MDNREGKEFILDQTTIKKLLTIYKLKIPDFQRNFVWKKGKKEQLLESLFRGFPIGAITLYQDDNAYYIIDGLQRINTLSQYLSCPYTVIPFAEFYKKTEADVTAFLQEKGLADQSVRLKKQLQQWYGNLKQLYEYEKISVLYRVLNPKDQKKPSAFSDLTLVEELHEIVKSAIEIAHDDIALIIYKGDKNDLPDLFKNINTGSVALSQYEILQSVWNDYFLDETKLPETFDAFNRELVLIQDDYDIQAVKERGRFDIFKNIVGLNHLICCNEKSETLFRFAAFKKISPLPVGEGMLKYYENGSMGFEIWSTLLCGASNKIIDAVDLIFQRTGQQDQINRFVHDLNRIILDAVDTAIQKLAGNSCSVMETKYHSLYIIAGIVFSEYDIDAAELHIRKTNVNSRIFEESLNLERHIEQRWFMDENRQMGFFNGKIGELLKMKSDPDGRQITDTVRSRKPTADLTITIEGQVIQADTVKEFYRNIFSYLSLHKIDFSHLVPYATGQKRYLIHTENRHLSGTPFFNPLRIGDYFIETHKSKSAALRDICSFLKKAGVDVTE